MGMKSAIEQSTFFVSVCKNPKCPKNGHVVESMLSNPNEKAMPRCPTCKMPVVQHLETSTLEVIRDPRDPKRVAHAYIR
jgi:hypothetical protein